MVKQVEGKAEWIPAGGVNVGDYDLPVLKCGEARWVAVADIGRALALKPPAQYALGLVKGKHRERLEREGMLRKLPPADMVRIFMRRGNGRGLMMLRADAIEVWSRGQRSTRWDALRRALGAAVPAAAVPVVVEEKKASDTRTVVVELTDEVVCGAPVYVIEGRLHCAVEELPLADIVLSRLIRRLEVKGLVAVEDPEAGPLVELRDLARFADLRVRRAIRNVERGPVPVVIAEDPIETAEPIVEAAPEPDVEATIEDDEQPVPVAIASPAPSVGISAAEEIDSALEQAFGPIEPPASDQVAVLAKRCDALEQAAQHQADLIQRLIGELSEVSRGLRGAKTAARAWLGDDIDVDVTPKSGRACR